MGILQGEQSFFDSDAVLFYIGRPHCLVFLPPPVSYCCGVFFVLSFLPMSTFTGKRAESCMEQYEEAGQSEFAGG
jgi:hypothetical protein